MNRNRIIYIAGPITGLPGENKEAFYTMATALKNQGFIVRNPHEFCNDIPLGSDWHVYMRRCITMLSECTDIVMLAGWEKSKGANLELNIAEALGLKIQFSWTVEFMNGQKTERNIA